MTSEGFRRIGIVGLGLMGGSLARDLKRLEDPPHLAASSLDPTDLRGALGQGVLDEACDSAEDAARGRDLVVYATPLAVTLEILRAHVPLWGDAVVTDLAGLKAPVMSLIGELGLSGRYVGSHPMAGREESGFAGSRPGLFRRARIWLVRGAGAEEAGQRLWELWRTIGARPAWTGADEHDRFVVPASHLPQVAANALAEVLARAGIPREALGSGGRDMTRLAASPPEMWMDLLRHSGPELAGVLRELSRLLSETAGSLETGDLEMVSALMERTRRWSREGERWS